MSGCLKWLFIIGIIALLTEYWPVIFVIVLIYLIYVYAKSKKKQRNEPCNVSSYTMDGHEFEQYCADLLKKNGFSNVYVTKGSGDFGIDILASKDGWKYAIQCKNYSSKVGNHAVQEAYSGKDYYNADIAVVMTNNFFTPAAIETADSLNVELWDGAILNNMINQYSLSDAQNIMLPKTESEIPERTKRKTEEHKQKELTCQKTQNEEIVPPSRAIMEMGGIETRETEITTMYDKEKGIYPSGEYLVGEDIPLGKYLLKQRANSSNGEIHIYKDYQTYLKNPDNELVFKIFKGDYHLSLRIEGNLLVIENADMQKI